VVTSAVASHVAEAGAVTTQALSWPEVVSRAIPEPASVIVMRPFPLTLGVIAVDGVKVNVATAPVPPDKPLAFLSSVIARPFMDEMPGNVPVLVVSRTTTGLAVTSFEDAAAMLANAACVAVGVVNNVTVNLCSVAAAYVPAVSFTVRTELDKATLQVPPDAGAVTVHALADPDVVLKAIPEPDRVMMRPAFVPLVIAVAGVKANVAVVCEALTFAVSVTASPVIAPPITAGQVRAWRATESILS